MYDLKGDKKYKLQIQGRIQEPTITDYWLFVKFANLLWKTRLRNKTLI